jgi:hypothetical protein
LCKDDNEDENNCTFGRGAGFSVAAMFSFFMAGLCFLLTKDYPGDRAIGAEKEQVNREASGVITDEEEGTQKRDAQEEEADDDVIVEEEEEPSEEEIIEEEVVEEYEDEDAGKPEEQDATNIHTTDSRLKDAEA